MSAEFCPLFQRAIELVGRRWTGPILRVLLTGEHRFNELLAAVPGLSDRLLAERLRELEEEGVVTRAVDPGPPLRVCYRITEKGSELSAAFCALATWAEKWIELEAAKPASVRPKAG